MHLKVHTKYLFFIRAENIAFIQSSLLTEQYRLFNVLKKIIISKFEFVCLTNIFQQSWFHLNL